MMMLRFLCIVLVLTAPLLAEPQRRILRETLPAAGGKPGYTLEASYPVFPSGVSPKVNQACADLIQGDLEQFKQAYQELALGNFGWTYQAKFSLESDTPDQLSILYTVVSRQDGAHPRQYFLTQAFSPRSGQAWQLRKEWLGALSAYCITDLKKQIHPKFGDAGDAQIERGAGPKLDNFKCVLPTAKGLKVYFPTDQIGPNLLGTRVVTVPYLTLQGRDSKSR